MKDLKYDSRSIQPDLINGQFTMKQIKLLFSLRSKSYLAKTNFSKMHRANLRCRLGCLEAENQTDIFENCEVLKSKVNYESKTSLNQIFGSLIEQKQSILILEHIDDQWKKMCDKILPGGLVARTPALF